MISNISSVTVVFLNSLIIEMLRDQLHMNLTFSCSQPLKITNFRKHKNHCVHSGGHGPTEVADEDLCMMCMTRCWLPVGGLKTQQPWKESLLLLSTLYYGKIWLQKKYLKVWKLKSLKSSPVDGVQQSGNNSNIFENPSELRFLDCAMVNVFRYPYFIKLENKCGLTGPKPVHWNSFSGMLGGWLVGGLDSNGNTTKSGSWFWQYLEILHTFWPIRGYLHIN